MKIQDLVFVLVFGLTLFLRDSRKSVLIGLLCLVVAMPLFYFHIFFTAERLTWYAAAFFLLAIFYANRH